MRINKFIVIVCLGWIIYSGCQHKATAIQKFNAQDYKTFFGTLNATDTLRLQIDTDFESIFVNKESSEKHYQSARIRAWDGQELVLDEKIEVRPRGVTRKRICDFPPLMLKMTDELLDSLGMVETDNLKLLSYCQESEEHRNYVLKEYLDYRLCNVLSDYSFLVKLTEIIYHDTGGQHEDRNHLGFIIEPADEMATRLGCELLAEEAPVKTIHKEHYKNLVVFQYMIGNSDWNFSRRHNIRMLSCDKKIGPHPVPYDFDYSGLVNAEYASPHPTLPIDSVTDRLFQWRGSVDEDFTTTYQLFQAKKPTFYKVCTDFPFLAPEIKKEITDYLDSFYKNIASPTVMEKEILKARSKS